MRRLPAFLAALLVLAPLPAFADDRVGPALDLVLGGGALAGPQHGADSAVKLGRVGAGVQWGRFAVLAHAEVSSFAADEPRLDSTGMFGSGFGLGARIELLAGLPTLVQVQLGYTWRTLDGDDGVERTCAAFATCTAGYYEERPRYDASGLFGAITVASRTSHRIWPAAGVQVGVAAYPLDRPGDAFDERGTLVWLALHLELGTGR